MALGLAALVAMIGPTAGPVFIEAIKDIGLTVFLVGVVVTLVPQTAGRACVRERAVSPVTVIGYSSTVASGQILIAIGGTALIEMLH